MSTPRPAPNTTGLCMAFGCDRPISGQRAFCGHHKKDPNPEVRFWPRVEKTATCWLWTGAVVGEGYGQVAVKGRAVKVHRFAFELLRGPIPEGMVLDHLCRVRNCVNPDHLEPVTGVVNTMRGINFAAINKRKTQCKNGHPFDPENTYWRPNGDGRDCKTCTLERGRRRDARAAARKSGVALVATAFWSEGDEHHEAASEGAGGVVVVEVDPSYTDEIQGRQIGSERTGDAA